MWLFAAGLVVVLGCVALLAAGFGRPMSEAMSDRISPEIPNERPISAADLRSVRFGVALRGYRMDQVDALLDRCAAQMESDSSASAESVQPATPRDQGV